MSTPVEEFASFMIYNSLKLAREEYERSYKGEGDVVFGQDGLEHLTTVGWYRIILHEEKRIRALKRQVNRLIEGNTIEGDEELYPEEET